jgi:hypothetical protein
MDPLPRTLVIAGLVLVAAGLWLHFGPSAPGLGLGRLPGDIRIERPGTRVYIPVTTSILLSVVLSLLFWIFSKWR